MEGVGSRAVDGVWTDGDDDHQSRSTRRRWTRKGVEGARDRETDSEQ